MQTAAGIVDGILAQTKNATDRMTDDLVQSSIYGSMDSSHAADEAALAAGKRAVEECNANTAARQAPFGDLGVSVRAHRTSRPS